MKVLHLSSESSWRGGEQQIIYLAEESIKLGVDVLVGCQKGSQVEQYCKDNELPFVSLRFKSAYDIASAWRLIRICRKESIDLLQTHSSKSHTLAVIAGLFGMKVPQILTRRVDFPVKDNWFSRFKYNYSKIAKIICVSETIKGIIQSEIRDNSKLITIHDGVDMHKFDEYKNTDWLRETFSIGKDKVVIGNTSAISYQKDYHTFLRAAKRVLKKHKNVHFFVVGDGPQREEIIQFAKKKGISENVTFTGFRRNIQEILPSIDIFLFTSQTEGLGTSILDAMVAQVPIVATAAGGVKEIVNHEVNGLLYKVKDHGSLAGGVIRLLEDKNLRDALVNRGKASVADYKKEKMAAQTLEVYRAILKEKGHSN